METIKIRFWADIPRNFTGIIDWADGDRFWYLNGEFHRIDGPAEEISNGHCYWWLDGMRLTKTEHTRLTRLYHTTLGKLIWKGG